MSSGSTSQPVSPSSMISAGPPRSTAIAGSSQAIPSTSTCPKLSLTDGSTTTSLARSSSGSTAWSCQPASSTPSAPTRLIASAGCSASHSVEWPPTITSEIPPPRRLRARVKASISSGTRLTSVNRPT